MAAAGRGAGLCCHPNHHHHHHHHLLFFSDRSHFPPQSSVLLCPPLRIRIGITLINANQWPALCSSSNSLASTSTVLLPSSSGIRPCPLAMVAESSMIRSLEEERQAAKVERLWQQFFWDPSQWWDKRFDKENPDAPDFKHKTTDKVLWISDRFSPSWLQAKLGTLSPHPLQRSSSSSSCSSIEDPGEAEILVHTCQASSATTQLWEEFFSDPSQWWDNRSYDKRNPKIPDFKHKTAKKALWIDNRFNPRWVHARLVAMIQCHEQGQSGSSTPEISGRVARMEQLWLEFFSDSSQWWDNRLIKKSPKYPDFKHKSTHEGLWIEGWLNPPWVKPKMATMALGQVQFGSGLRSGAPDSFCDNVSKLCREGRFKEALQMVELMVQQNIKAPINVYVALLKGCARRKALAEGKRVHFLIVQSGLDSHIALGKTLVYMYAKCGSVLDARKVFNTMPEHNVFSWTAIISAYTDHGQAEEAISLFHQMQQTDMAPDKVAFVVVLKACASIAALKYGKQLHSVIIESGFESDVIVGSALVDMYAKCGCIEHARQAFNKISERNVVSWSAMIAGYTQNGLGKEALALYVQMKREGVHPSIVTYVIVLSACASIAALEQGKQLHCDIIRSGFESDMIVGNALVDMYAKCGSIEDARQVFNKMSERDVVSWTAMVAGYAKCGCIEHARQVFNEMGERNVVSWNSMIAGYAQNGLGKEALALYEQMKQEGVQPNTVTYVSILSACATIGALEKGKQLHLDIIRSGFESDMTVGNTLIDMYAKCGCIEYACQVFNKMSERDVISWNSMVAGYAQNGHGKEALALYEQMRQQGVQPNDVTFVSVLSACSHSGLVDEGRHLFYSMCKDHGVTPNMTHYACMVDLLGRAGCLADAEDFINKMPIPPDAVIWMTLLGAARNHVQVDIGRRAFDRVVKLEPGNAAP